MREECTEFLAPGASCADYELLEYAAAHHIPPRHVEGVGEVMFRCVRPFGTYDLSTASLGFFGYTQEPTSDAAVRAAFEEALEAGAFE